MITKSGGNSFRGTAGYAYQPLRWDSDNTHHKTVFDLSGTPLAQHSTCPNLECTTTGGTPVQADIGQFDGSFGGPIMKDRVLVLRLVPQVSRRDPDQPELEKRQRHPELLSRR